MERLENYWVSKYYYAARDQLQRHVYRRSEEAFIKGDQDRDAIRTVQELRKRQAWIRRQFIASIGGLPESHCPLKSQVTGVHQDQGFSIQKVIFQSRLRHYVTANLYLPDGLAKPTGAVQFLCGHAAEGKAYPNYQTVCRALASAGLIVLAQDPIGQGERWSYYDPALKATTVPILTIEHDYVGAQCLALGDSLARYFLHDAMRGIDYLLTRPEVDPQRIGVTGNSGGGTQTAMMMLADPRISAAAPGTFLMNRHAY
jgi:dipeptidyl aminopeptidase/acylaminoacyl peptidase